MIQVYEVPNTFTRDLPLDEQIALGINDWRAECGEQVAFGHTREEALNNLNQAA
jgi:hypothetical protein